VSALPETGGFLWGMMFGCPLKSPGNSLQCGQLKKQHDSIYAHGIPINFNSSLLGMRE
jgi:hypothetical protein